ncbi:MAG: HypC/HybG/HupF family hydrogenase formation chaperone [Acidimicrobiales bacterium]|nr:HypC/HybG/HupF family hydrogenase formation chaperone [Acidimicrobiales bacterium]
MCLGVPGRVVEIHGEDLGRTARVDFGGVEQVVSLAYVPEVQVGDYTIVHVGFAITRLDEAAALETLDLFAELGAGDEPGTTEPSP